MEINDNVNTKQDNLHLRITKKEKENLKSLSVARGFDTITAYLMYLVRQDNREFFKD